MPNDNDSSRSTHHKLMRAFFSGAFAGATEVLINHPLFSLKLLFQAKTDTQTKNHPLYQFKESVIKQNYVHALKLATPAVRSLYWGIGPNMASMIPITAVQVMVGQYTAFKLNENTPFQPASCNLIAGFAGGVAASTIASPIEYILAQLQLYNGKHSTTPLTFMGMSARLSKSQKLHVITTGLFGTALRDGFFTCTFFAAMPIAKEWADNKIKNPFFATFTANTSLGIGVSVLTQSIDTAKARQQQISSNRRISLFTAAKEIFEEGAKIHKHGRILGGILSLNKGGFFRGLRIVSALTVIDEAQKAYKKYMP